MGCAGTSVAEWTGMRNLLLVGSSSLLLAACSGDPGAGISVQALRGPGDAPIADGAGTPYQLTSGLLHLRHIELDLPSGTSCDDVSGDLSGASCHAADQAGDEDKLRIDGPIVVDLVTATATPSLAGVVIPAGTYRRIDLRVDDGDPAEGVVAAGSPLDDNAFAIVAGFDLHGTPTVLDLRTNFDEDIRIEQPGGVVVGAGDDLIARFAVADWLAGVDLVACLDSGIPVEGGRAVIDDRSSGACAGIEDAIKLNMKESRDLSNSDDD